MIPREQWEWYGIASHLIVGHDCQFHLATVVGDFLISTVGEYMPDEGVREIHAEVRGVKLAGRGDARQTDFFRKFGWVEIGAGRKYETMVFPLGSEVCREKDCMCGYRLVSDWSELDVDGYNIRGEAHRGHMRMCQAWAEKQTERKKGGKHDRRGTARRT
jgi:hypothetical protein